MKNGMREKRKKQREEKETSEKGCAERQEQKSRVSESLVVPSITEEEKIEIVVLRLSSVVVSCWRSGIDLSHPSISLERGRKMISSVQSSL